jgi:endogenous inhibitor of DNA gyrase (YacG/DUF329 family)
MEIIEVVCANCSKKIFIQEECARELLFCTLKCMDIFNYYHNDNNYINGYE